MSLIWFYTVFSSPEGPGWAILITCRASSVRLSVHTFERLLWKPWASFLQTSRGAFCWKGIENFYKWSRFVNQYGRRARMAYKDLKIFYPRIMKALRLYWHTASGTQIVQMVILRVCWPLTFLRQGKIFVPMHLYRENIEKSVSQNVLKTNGWNWQCMIKVANPFSYNHNFVPPPSPPPPPLPHTQTRTHTRDICPCPWATYMYKIS